MIYNLNCDHKNKIMLTISGEHNKHFKLPVNSSCTDLLLTTDEPRTDEAARDVARDVDRDRWWTTS